MDAHPIATVVHPVHQPLQVGMDANGVLVDDNSNNDNDPKAATIALEFPTTTRPLSPVSVGHLAQHTFGKILYNHATSLEHSTLRYETQVTDIKVINNERNKMTSLLDTSSSQAPPVQIKTNQGHVIHANLCLAADGANSFVRQQLGIPWEPTTQPQP